jgi:hypothetical protein
MQLSWWRILLQHLMLRLDVLLRLWQLLLRLELCRLRVLRHKLLWRAPLLRWWLRRYPLPLEIATLTVPLIPSASSKTSVSTCSSPLILPSGTKIWLMSPEIGVEALSSEVRSVIIAVIVIVAGTITLTTVHSTTSS